MTSVWNRWAQFERERSAILLLLFQGILTFLVVPVATANLTSQESSTFIIAWSVLNTSTLAVFSPVELMAPAIVKRFGIDSPTTQPNVLLINRFYIVAGVLTAAVVPIIVGLLTGDWDVQLMVASAIYVLAFALFSLFRSRSFGLDQIARAAMQTGVALLLWLPLAGLLILTEKITIASLIISVAAAYALATILLVSGSVKTLWKSGELIERGTRPTNARELAGQYSNVAASGLATLLIQQIGVLLAAVIDTPPEVIVTYGSALVLVRAGFAALSSLTPPFAVRYANYRNEQNRAAYLKLFALHSAMLLLTIFLAGIAAATFGEEFLELYTNQPSALGPGLLVLVCLGEGFTILSIVPRLILVNESRTRILSIIFPIGAIVSAAVVLIPTAVEPSLRLALAPLTGGLLICVVLFPVATRQLLKIKHAGG